MNHKQGFYLFGICKGFRVDQRTADGKTYVNYRLGIARTYQGHYDETNEEVIEVDILQDDQANIGKVAEAYKGKPVVIEVVPRARKGGKQGAWLSLFAPKGSALHLQTMPAAKVAEVGK
jgi:hypothetical protein